MLILFPKSACLILQIKKQNKNENKKAVFENKWKLMWTTYKTDISTCGMIKVSAEAKKPIS